MYETPRLLVINPVRHRVRGMLSEAAKRTKTEHLRKVRQGIVAVIETIAPGQKDETWAELTRSGILDTQFNARKMGRMQIEAGHSIHALPAAYRQSEARVTKLQFCQLSIYSRNGKFKIYTMKLQNTNCFKLKNI